MRVVASPKKTPAASLFRIEWGSGAPIHIPTQSETFEVKNSNPCTVEKSLFLSNYTNKERFVTMLAENLKSMGFQVVLCPSDADTTIVKTALDISQSSPVTVLSDDTDVFCLLLHHLLNQSVNNIYLKNMTRKRSS